jgi:hypothetical protein
MLALRLRALPWKVGQSMRSVGERGGKSKKKDFVQMNPVAEARETSTTLRLPTLQACAHGYS